ncbi:unnamed protein product [Cuscuta epithymum]|uniref:AT hook motif-containing protein n=1 Tax=Cuscuta epithymum TaxID=186058 RepID=A0AAV0BVQ0_9ASTE|nr:unnamed protein product [Cuscuta epithymum]
MSNAIQMDHSNSQLALPVKRRRGRPRKDQSLNHLPRAPTGIETSTENPAPRVVVDGMVGQAVTGVIEATFDAGFLLSVTIGDNNTKLRGIVFKPGHYVPITSENDIAPHVEMIRRNEINLPVGNKIRIRRKYRRRVSHVNAPPPSPPLHQAAKGNQLSIVLAPSVPPVGARGTVVPVVLQPANLTNRAPSAGPEPMNASQASKETLRDKGVQMVAPLAMLPPDGSTTHEGVENVKNQISGGHGYTHSSPESFSLGGKMKDDVDKSQTIEPLEGSDSNGLHHSESHPLKSMAYGAGKMTKLLQVLQEKLVENKVHEPDNEAGLRNKSY